MTGDIDQYKKLGMNDHVGKPFTSQELWNCLLKYFTPVGFQSMGVVDNKEDDTLQKQLKVDFLKENQAKYEEIKNAIDIGEITLAHRLAHTLKSSAALVGRSELQKIAASIEASLKDGKNPVTEAQMDTLHFELRAALDMMAIYKEETAAKRSGTETAGGFDAVMARELIEKLEPLLKSGNAECLSLIGRLRSIPGSDELIQHIEDFCFSTASALLSRLKEKLEADEWKIK
jgi:HPt (histidine-containing phosphotransfer) domain-containing protein